MHDSLNSNSTNGNIEQISAKIERDVLEKSYSAVAFLREYVLIDDYNMRFMFETHMYLEYLYFYLHLLKRTLFNLITDKNALMKFLGRLTNQIFSIVIIQTAEDYPDEDKMRLLETMFKNMNKADSEYIKIQLDNEGLEALIVEFIASLKECAKQFSVTLKEEWLVRMAGYAINGYSTIDIPKRCKSLAPLLEKKS